MSTIIQIQLRRDTLANWTANNPVLALGEPSYVTDTGKLKFGDGATAWNSLYYFETDKNFVFVQGVASSSWAITHNLNKFPACTVVDSGGTVVEGDITNVDNNNLIITFNNAFSGKAYIN